MKLFDNIKSPRDITNDLEAIAYCRRLSESEKKAALLCLLLMIADGALKFTA